MLNLSGEHRYSIIFLSVPERWHTTFQWGGGAVINEERTLNFYLAAGLKKNFGKAKPSPGLVPSYTKLGLLSGEYAHAMVLSSVNETATGFC